MELKLLTPDELNQRCVADLGLDFTAIDLSSTEAMAASLRRAAGFLCPCPPRSLVNNVLSALQDVFPTRKELKEGLENTLDLLVNIGDLFELEETQDGRSRKLLYTAPPAFVMRQSGLFILLGIAPDRATMLPDDLGKKIDYLGHLRRFFADSEAEAMRNRLLGLGWIEIPQSKWIQGPLPEDPSHLIKRLDKMLDGAKPCVELNGLSVLDLQPSRFYRGRWVEPSNRSGRFVGRRPQAYGAELWCYVEMKQGIATRFIDFPMGEGAKNGRDEAWRVQMAMDRIRGGPQRYRLRPGQVKTHIIDFFGPIPSWAQRRLDVIGTPVPASHVLFSYCIDDAELQEELQFLKEFLWLESE